MDLLSRCPGVPLLALGQTVLWDEPMKAVLLRHLEQSGPDTVLWLGVMDTDYFSRPPTSAQQRRGYAVLPHNDGTTKDLWVATGEVSRLFGCELVPGREVYARYGVQLEALARTATEGRRAFIDRATSAWGWTGLVNLESRRMLAGDVPLADVLPTFRAQLEEALGATVGSIAGCARSRADRQAAQLLSWVDSFASANPHAKLVELFLDLGPRIYQLLAGQPAVARLRTALSSELLRFNASTVQRPRFRALDLFLRPETAEQAKRCYDESVHGSEIYTLDKFGPGAIPFDLVIPGHGRGTICVIGSKVVVQADEPVYIHAAAPIRSAEDLAVAVEDALGPNASLIGKAVTLLSMLGAEFIVVLNETASAYVWRTERMTDLMCQREMCLPLYPILRLRYPTWDCFGSAKVDIHLPDHLSFAFGKPTLSSEEFARRWRQVRDDMQGLLDRLARVTKTRDIMVLLCEMDPASWQARLEQFEHVQQALLDYCTQIERLKARTQELYSELRSVRRECEQLAREKGEDYRTRVAPLKERLRGLAVEGRAGSSEAHELQRQLQYEQERRQEYDRRWEALRQEVRTLQAEIAATRARRRAIETGEQLQALRRHRLELIADAQRAKLELVRNAYLACYGLRQTNNRPSAWWIPVLSPDGAWFNAIADGTEAYLEPLS
ncbi:MAG: hypothetical protein ACUVRO_05845, partial [Armatimonadota bacterium]